LPRLVGIKKEILRLALSGFFDAERAVADAGGSSRWLSLLLKSGDKIQSPRFGLEIEFHLLVTITFDGLITFSRAVN
jgi:hypothetical protein